MKQSDVGLEQVGGTLRLAIGELDRPDTHAAHAITGKHDVPAIGHPTEHEIVGRMLDQGSLAAAVHCQQEDVTFGGVLLGGIGVRNVAPIRREAHSDLSPHRRGAPQPRIVWQCFENAHLSIHNRDQ